MRIVSFMLAIALPAASAAAAPPGTSGLNGFEWVQAAPIVVTAASLGENGPRVEVEVDRVLRGDVAPGAVLRIDVRSANRERDHSVDPKPLRLDQGESYAILLERSEDSGDKPSYRLVRGVRGARPLPLEGRERYVEVLHRFVELQDAHSEAVLWDGMERLLDETDPALVGTALAQFLKFRRGEPDLVLSLRPLLDHPSADIRADAARLAAQIVERHGPDVPDVGALRQELVARARRDEAVSVRVAATEALGEFSDPAAHEVLTEIAATDPEQDVRYAAEMVLLRHHDAARAD